MADITETFPECGLSHFWKGDSHKEDCNDITDTEAVDTDISVGLARLSRKLVIFDGINTSLPLSANDLSDIDTEAEYFKELCHDYVCEQVIDKELSDFIERNTQDQSDCSLWKELHNGRLTSSTFGEIFNRRDDTAPHAICKRLMGYTPMIGSPPQLKWGKEKESVARMDYISKMKELGHKDITVQPSGLTLMSEHAFLGATADGIVSNHRYYRDSKGVLEIKCPYSIQKSPVNTKSPSDIAKDHKRVLSTVRQRRKIAFEENQPLLLPSTGRNGYQEVQVGSLCGVDGCSS